MSYIYYNNELYHHGVQGQKWGVRNAEWYPIDEWKASLKNKSSSQKDSIVKRVANKRSQRSKLETGHVDGSFKDDLVTQERNKALYDYYYNRSNFNKKISAHEYSKEQLDTALNQINSEARMKKEINSTRAYAIMETKEASELLKNVVAIVASSATLIAYAPKAYNFIKKYGPKKTVSW